MKINAFSLIELMVVIAIVAILSAVAVPAYRGYVVKAKTSQVIDIIEGLSKQSILFSQTHGYFADAYDLGLSSTPGSTRVDNPSEFLPAAYFAAPDTGIALGDNSSPAPCGQKGQVMVIVDAHALGIPQANATGDGLVAFAHIPYNTGGVINYLDYYYVYLASNDSYVGDDYVTGWLNMVLPGGTTTNQEVLDKSDLINTTAECQ